MTSTSGDTEFSKPVITFWDVALFCEQKNAKEVPDAWQMPVCGPSPRTISPVSHITSVREEPEPLLPSSDLRPVKSSNRFDKPDKSAYQLPIQRRCSHKKPDKVAFAESALSDLSLTSVSDGEKKSTEKKEKKKSAALWKPNGPTSPKSAEIQKVIKKKKIEKKKARKRVALVQRRSTDRFSDKFSDITRTTTDDSAGSLVSDHGSDSVADGKEIVDGEETTVIIGGGEEKATEPVALDTEVAMETEDAKQPSIKYLEKSVLDTVTEGVTEGIPEITEWNSKGKVRASTGKKLSRGKSRSSLKAPPPTAEKPSPIHDLLKQHLNTRVTRVTSAPPPTQQRPNSESASVTKPGTTTVAMVTQRLTTKSAISRRMETRAEKRVHSAPEMRNVTPPNLNRTKQGCPLTFSELARAEEKSGVESKWVLQCIETDMLYKSSSSKNKKRIVSAPPRFSHPPGSLRPPYMDKPPKPAVEPAYDEEWHEKVIERQENRRKLADKRHIEAAERRRAMEAQKQQKAALMRDRSTKSSTRSGGKDYGSASPPPVPLPTAASFHSSPPRHPPNSPLPPHSHPGSAYRVRSALSTRPGSSSAGRMTRPSSASSDHLVSDNGSFGNIQVEATIPPPLHSSSTVERSPLLAKAAFLRNASQQYLYHSAVAATSVG